MISDSQWASLRWYRKSDFSHPDNLDWSVVTALDQLSTKLGQKATVLSDYRPTDTKFPNSQHLVGRAIDVSFPGLDSLQVLGVIRSSRLFSGFGLYTNDQNVQSFHVDTRTARTVDNPATWGDVIDHSTGKRVDSYTSLDAVINLVKKNAGTIGLGVLILGVAAFLILRKTS